MIKLPTLAGVFDDPNPDSQIEQFLAAPLQENPDLPDLMQLYYARLNTTLAQLEKTHTTTKIHFEARWNGGIREYQKEKDPITGKLYSIEAAERELKCDREMILLREQLAELTRRIAILKGYLRAIEMKSRHLPGSQGSMNRDKEMEMGSRRQRQ